MGEPDRIGSPERPPDAIGALSDAGQEDLARLGEGWADDVLTEPQGRLLAWLVSAGAAGVLAGGIWWRAMLRRKRDPVARPDQIDAAIREFSRHVADMGTVTVAIQDGLERVRDRQRRILEAIDQSCTRHT